MRSGAFAGYDKQPRDPEEPRERPNMSVIYRQIYGINE